MQVDPSALRKLPMSEENGLGVLVRKISHFKYWASQKPFSIPCRHF
ncbi:hypothetical protein SynMVIR181_00542 [Synechococcus sp. MVIR-18-1]|nr:hypothetical protein SynMVIR181_00542 [Synechococcus sp. MVIR-18-1]